MPSQSPDQGRSEPHTPLSLRGGGSEPVEQEASYPGKLEVSTHQDGGGLIWG